MFFVLSKLLGFFAIPSNFVVLIGIGGLLLLPTRFAQAGRWLAVVSLIVMAVIGFSPVGNALIIPLENRFPPWDASRGAPDGIIVLGGAIDGSGRGNEVALNEGAERLIVVPELARRYPNARILFSGGTSALINDGDPEAKFALRLLESLGVARGRIMLEDRSRNTVENAVYSKAIVKPKPDERWLLVTSAYHMPRAIGVFRKAGFPVEPYPVDWRTRGVEDALYPFAAMSEGLRRTDTAMHEWLGLAIYWLTGRTSELFPVATERTAENQVAVSDVHRQPMTRDRALMEANLKRREARLFPFVSVCFQLVRKLTPVLRAPRVALGKIGDAV